MKRQTYSNLKELDQNRGYCPATVIRFKTAAMATQECPVPSEQLGKVELDEVVILETQEVR